MRKTVIFIVMALLMFPKNIFAEQIQVSEVSYGISVNDREEKIKNPIISFNDRTYLPVRELSEILGLYVSWDGAENTIKISDCGIVNKNDADNAVFADENTISAQISDFKVKINGYYKNFENPVINVNDKAYLPLRELSELFGLQVNWNGELKTISICSDKQKADDTSVDGLLAFRKDGLWGYMDSEGNVMIQPQYYSACDFSEGLGAVLFNEDEDGIEESKWSFIDKNGDIVIPSEYWCRGKFSDGLVTAEIYDERSGPFIDENDRLYKYAVCLDKNGNIAFGENFRFEYIDEFSDGYAAADYIVINPENNTIEGFMPVYIDRGGNIVKMFGDGIKHEDIDLGKFKNGFAVIKDLKYSTHTISIINTDFETVFSSNEYDSINLGGNFITAKKNNKYGVVDFDNSVIIDFKYDYLSEYSEGLFAFRNESGAGYIDINDNVVIQPDYERTSKFFNGMAIVGQKDNEKRFDIIDKNGGYIQRNIPFEYYYRNDNGIIRVHTFDDIQYINASGEFIIPKLSEEGEIQ